MIKTPLSTVIGGTFWTPSAMILGGASKTLNQIIKSLFANGEQGFAYDPNDLSTMYQDAAGSVPVTAVGQPVGLMKDKSGRNNHAFQNTSASHPILRKNAVTGANYLEFDGSDDFLQTNNIDFTATDKVSLFAGVRKLSDAATGVVVEFGTDSFGTNGTFGLVTPLSATISGSQFRSRGSVFSSGASTSTQAPNSFVFVGKSSILEDLLYAKFSGVVSTSTADQGTGNYGNYPLYIGRRAGSTHPFNGHIYGLIGIGRLTTDDETAVIEKEIAKRLGVTLNV